MERVPFYEEVKEEDRKSSNLVESSYFVLSTHFDFIGSNIWIS